MTVRELIEELKGEDPNRVVALVLGDPKCPTYKQWELQEVGILDPGDEFNKLDRPLLYLE